YKKKTERQLIQPTSSPPTTGPKRPDELATADQTPIAAPRLVAGKIRLITLSGCGLSSEAPKPWMARAKMSHSIVGANAHAVAANVKTAMPTKYTLRCPKRSPNRPVTSKGTAKV